MLKEPLPTHPFEDRTFPWTILPPNLEPVEFGEKLLYKVKPKDKNEKINLRWDYGIFVGVRRRSGELTRCLRSDRLEEFR